MSTVGFLTLRFKFCDYDLHTYVCLCVCVCMYARVKTTMFKMCFYLSVNSCPNQWKLKFHY